MWVFIDGTFVEKEQAKISLLDRGFLFGEGVFTTIKINQGKCEFYLDHMARLTEHAQQLKLPLPAIKLDDILALIKLNHAQEGTWRLKIIITALHTVFILENFEEKKIQYRLAVFPMEIENPLGKIKTLSYCLYLHAYYYAQERGYHDCLLIDSQKNILETSRANIFWLDKGVCWIPDCTLNYLKGIILSHLIRVCPYPIKFTKNTLAYLPDTAHVYICNALIHCKPVIAIQEREFERNIEIERKLENAISHEER